MDIAAIFCSTVKWVVFLDCCLLWLHKICIFCTGEIVCEYAGEVISQTEAKLRAQMFPTDTFLFIIHEASAAFQRTTFIDARLKGNHARFINHSSEPNLVMLPVRVDIIVPHLICFAKKDIQAGEELTVDYGQGEKNSALSSTRCLCSSQNCRNFLPMNANFDVVFRWEEKNLWS